MTGIILAGGENSRMGTDKAFLAFQGRPLIERTIDVLSPLFATLIVVTNRAELYRSYPVQVVSDALDRRGPMTGIYSGMLRSTGDLNFVVACDMPHLNAQLISFMAQAADGHDAVVPKVGGYAEPLHAFYARRILPLVEAKLAAGEQRIQSLYNSIDVRYVTEEDIDRHDPRRRSFRNVNTPDEYKEAACSD